MFPFAQQPAVPRRRRAPPAGDRRLGGLLDEVVFVGGATVGLWITDPATPTKDVDAIVGVTSCGRFYEFQEFLRWHGFREDAASGVICRWRHHELMLDVMPTDASILPAPQ